MGETHGEMLGINGCCTHHSRTDIMWEAGMVEVRELIGTSLRRATKGVVRKLVGYNRWIRDENPAIKQFRTSVVGTVEY
jgi:hypothetical protein